MLKHIKNTEEWNDKGLAAKGFTLIELLVVIVILGILAAVVVFAVSGITDKGQISACKTEARTVRTAAEAFYAQGSAYAATPAALVSGGFLSQTPTLVTYTQTSATSYTLAWTSGSKCAPGGTPISGLNTTP